jgi:cation transport regulator ChaB
MQSVTKNAWAAVERKYEKDDAKRGLKSKSKGWPKKS